jgi:hypothetical protein
MRSHDTGCLTGPISHSMSNLVTLYQQRSEFQQDRGQGFVLSQILEGRPWEPSLRSNHRDMGKIWATRLVRLRHSVFGDEPFEDLDSARVSLREIHYGSEEFLMGLIGDEAVQVHCLVLQGEFLDYPG